MNVNTTSTYVNNASSSSGLSGLASGMDTEKMVEAMLANTQAKIDKQTGVKQQIEWRQEIYRSIIAKINTFQTKYFSSSNNTNLLSQSFFNAMSAVTTSSAFKVSATSAAAVGNTKIQVNHLATNTKVTSGAAVSGRLAGAIDAAALQDLVDKELSGERKVIFKAGGKNIEVDLTDIFVQGGNFNTTDTDAQKTQAILARINGAFASEGLDGVKAEVKNGTLTITGDTSVSVSSDSSEMGLRALGLAAGKATTRTAVTTDDGETYRYDLTSTLNLKNEFSFQVSLDDNAKNVNIDLSKILEPNGVTVNTDKFMAAFQSELNRVHGATQVAGELVGQVELLYNAGSNSFELKVGTGRKVMVGGTTAAMNILGTKNGQSNKIGLGGSLKDLYFSTPLQGSRQSFTINGQSFTFDGKATISEVMNEINGSSAGVRLVYKPLEDKFVMEATNSGKGFDIQMSQEEGNLLSAMFGSGADGTLKTGASVVSSVFMIGEGKDAVAATGGNTLAELGLGSLAGLADTTTLDELSGLTGGQLRFEDGRIIMTGSSSGFTAAEMTTLFGRATVTLGSAAGLTQAVGVPGQNAEVVIDDVVTERSSNSFTVNGLNIELKAQTTGVETIEVTRGTDQIVDGIKSFINDYNALIGELNTLLREDASYKTYAPLTDAQKKEMSEREIELWEEKAKAGLLHGDSAIEGLLNSMRNILNSTPDGSSISLYNLGIESSSDWKDFGKLVLSADGETRLRQMIDKDPDAVLNLFTNEENGLAVKLNKALSDAANQTSGSPGSLVQIAGLKGKATETNNDLYYRLKAIEDKIAALKRTYEAEKNRYWTKFNAMEQLIANMNSQSSWLTQQLG